MFESIPSKQLVQAIEFASKCVRDNSSLPILSCVKLEPGPEGGIWVTGTNLDVCLRKRTGGVAPPVCVRANKLLHFTRTIGQGVDIEIKTDNNRVELIGAGGSARIPYMDPAEFPAMPLAPAPKPNRPAPGDIADALEFAGICCDPSSTDFIQTVVRLCFDDPVAAQGTDKRSLSYFNRVGPDEMEDAILVPKKFTAELIDVLRRPNAQYSFTESFFFAWTSEESVAVKLGVGDLPDLRAVLKQGLNPFAKVDAAEMLNAFSTARALKTDKDLAGVKITAVDKAGRRCLRLFCETQAGVVETHVSGREITTDNEMCIFVDSERGMELLSALQGEVAIGMAFDNRMMFMQRGNRCGLVALLTTPVKSGGDK